MKKIYNSPIVKSENIEIGIFGQYGSNNGNNYGNPGFGWNQPHNNPGSGRRH